MGITKELFIFLSAILSGAIVRLVYRCISCLRNVIHHTHWIIELEDLAYWVGTAIFLWLSGSGIEKLYVRGAGFWMKHLKKAGKKDRIKAINR